MELKEVYTDLCPEQIYDRHCHTHYEIICVLGGSVTVNLEGARYDLRQGQCIVIRPLRYHTVTGNNTLYHRLLVDFGKAEIPEDLQECFDRRIAREPVFYCEKEFTQLYKTNIQYGAVHKPLIYAMFTQLLYKLAYVETAQILRPQHKNKLVQSVISYVDEHLGESIVLRELAEHLYVSESTLCHMFKEEMQISLKQYILRKKMMYAKTLLFSGMSPAEVAEACGYRNYASFYKVFLKFTGMMPSELLSAKKEIRYIK